MADSLRRGLTWPSLHLIESIHRRSPKASAKIGPPASSRHPRQVCAGATLTGTAACLCSRAPVTKRDRRERGRARPEQTRPVTWRRCKLPVSSGPSKPARCAARAAARASAGGSVVIARATRSGRDHGAAATGELFGGALLEQQQRDLALRSVGIAELARHVPHEPGGARAGSSPSRSRTGARRS